MARVAKLASGDGAAPLAHRALAMLAPTPLVDTEPAARWLAGLAESLPAQPAAAAALSRWRERTPAGDRRLRALCERLGLGDLETLAAALAVAVDTDAMAGRAVAWLQASGPAVHPSVGLLGCLAEGGAARGLVELLDGPALDTGLLVLEAGEGGGLQLSTLRVPTPLLVALGGGRGSWPEARLLVERPPPLAADSLAALYEEARALLTAGGGLAIRSGHPQESRAAAQALAEACGHRAAVVTLPPPPGLGPWLAVHGALPVICRELQAGERLVLPRLAGHDGPWLVATGPDGSWALADEAGTAHGLASWNLPLPAAAERCALWLDAGAEPDAAALLGRRHRHSAARIQGLARASRGHAEAPAAGFGLAEVARAARLAGRGELGALAELLPGEVPDDALVLPDALRDDLETLTARCHARDGLADGLGPATRARYRPGVRALLTGPSGTGKTLASAWLATRLGLPLYRVDLASVSSKYIGETEKNLGELFARAEHAEVVLLFDEADALFGKRTDVRDANDRFANQQTNYLLQRIESFDGIVLLTSNARGRFDSAFTRRLDVVLEFPQPLPAQRRALWLAHLGPGHAVEAGELNRLAGECELAGGHIRNIVLAARALADGGAVRWQHLVPAMQAEYRKLGRSLPAGIGTPPRRE